MLCVTKNMVSDLSTSKLSIYDEPKNSTIDSSDNSNLDLLGGRKGFGVSAMMLISDVRDKYNNAVTAFHNFKTYASSTEGKIKFSVMFVSLAGGCVLSYRSASKRLWYKRLIPVGTLSAAASVCYPYAAWEVGKKFSQGVVTSYNITKFVTSYTYGKLKTLSEKHVDSVSETNSNTEQQYTVDDQGILNKTNKPENIFPEKPLDTKEVDVLKLQDNKHENNIVKYFSVPDSKPSEEKDLKPTDQIDKEKLTENKSDFYKVVSMSEYVEKQLDNIVPKGDLGQSSAEDTDLYTTRS